MKPYIRTVVFSIILLFAGTDVISQGRFQLKNASGKQSVSFKLLNNLIVFPIEVNGRPLNFILDSGVGATLLFNLNNKDSVMLHNKEKVKLQGLGSEESVEAILSKGNVFAFGSIGGLNQSLYLILDDSFDLSSKLGITVHGIIGYEILKDFVVDINYGTKRITFYDPNKYKSKVCKKCETLDLAFFKLKPYINVGIKTEPGLTKIIPVKLLIDSGGSDALWLFENSHPDILAPKKFFNDFLGEGLSGTVYGKRTYIGALVIGKFELENPTVSFPDSASISYARQFEERNGSLGASVLKRFNVTFDYRNKKISFKKGSFFKEPFRYNMSGIELVYNGKQLVKEQNYASIGLAEGKATEKNTVILDYNYKYTFKPSYKIHNLQAGSPAFDAGLLAGDIVIKINGKFTHEMELDEIVGKFFQKENTKISLVVERNGKDYEYHFYLKDVLK
ncbi:MAG: aspartyl protease family protein [Lutibacter sp.]|nr:aspartyl protease family protein [Lutibacter sp.]